jgi:hypothetical protein
MWINPDNPGNFVISNDGGAAVTFDAGKSWSSQGTQATAQFYRINVDNQFPYRIYGGQQDNSSVVITSRELGSGGITTAGWRSSAGGESAFLAFDPDNPRYVLGGSYQGTIEVIDTTAVAGTNIMAAPIQYLGMDAKDMKYRFNWNAPIIWSRHEPNTFYHGAQLLLKTTDAGKTWKEVSPDLTRKERTSRARPAARTRTKRSAPRTTARWPTWWSRPTRRSDLDWQRRRTGAGHTRRRRHVEERDAEGPRGMPDQRD